MSPSLIVSYDLYPPSSTSAPPNLFAATMHDIPLQVSSSRSELGENSNAYYAALRDAIAEAKNITGQELTEWRDAVGDAEKEKSGGKAEQVDEVDEEGEEEGQELETEVKTR